VGQGVEHDRQQRVVRDHPHVQFRLRRNRRGGRRLLSRRSEGRDRRPERPATVNNGVYRAGFATSQEAYEEAFRALFETLDWLEARLSAGRFLCGDRLTEADWRLFTTLIRFDPVYFGHFKCNLRRIKDYPLLSRYLKELYHWPGVAETVDFLHIKHHYYESHRRISPTGIVPVGPEIEL
jgi:putative glutathione S-transferase